MISGLDDLGVLGEHPARVLRRGRIPAVLAGLEIGVYVGPASSLALGVRKEDVQLRQALDLHLSNLRRSQGWNRLVVEYFGPLALEALKQARAN